MDETLESLILDLLDWIAPRARPYDEVMEAWRTSCPRLPVWEEAIDRGLLSRRHLPQRGGVVELTPLGRGHLAKHRGRSNPALQVR